MADDYSNLEPQTNPDTTVAAAAVAVDYKNRPLLRSNSGGWTSAAFIISVEIAERFAYYGIGANLITYLTGPLRQSTAAAAANVNAWSGTASLLPLLGAFVADSFLGRYRTILIASGLYILGLGLLTLSAMLHPVSSFGCQKTDNENTCSPPMFQVVLFFSSLYLIAVAQGGHKPCAQAFGADQFDSQDPAESKAKSSFFNWWYFGVCAGALVTIFVVSYIQENLSWSLGFGIPCVAMLIALVVFLLGTRTYRFIVSKNDKGPFMRIGRVFVAAFRNRRATFEDESTRQSSQHFKFLNKALVATTEYKKGKWECSSVAEVEEAKLLLGLIPIWCTCLTYGIVFAQTSTFFTKQGATMERHIFLGFKIPAASLQCFISATILTAIPIYDRVFVPCAASLTKRRSGITMLQRIGCGIFISVLAMAVSARVETKRLSIAREQGNGRSMEVVPMSVWWLVPQYIIFGIADVFTMVGLQEFFYDQAPSELRSVGLALYLSIFGVGSFLSSFMVSVIDKASGCDGKNSWFSNDLNTAHLDDFYWLLAGLSALGFVSYLYFAKSYIYRS